MRFNEVFSARAIAYRLTNDPSNAMPYLGEAFFPRKKKMGIDLKWIKAHNGLGIALKPSAYDALATIRPRQGFEILKEEMPLFREAMTISEQDLAEIQRASESSDPYLQDVLNHIYNDVQNLVEGANIASERMRMGLIAPAGGEMKITIGTADNTIYAYDYDPDDAWKATNYEEISSSYTWDKPSAAKPLNDIQDGIDALAAKGYTARYAVMNSTTLNLLVACDQIANALITITGRQVDFVDRQSAKEVFQRKTGLTPIIYDKSYIGYDGQSAKFYPDNYVSIIAEGALGNTWYGVTPEERTLIGDSKVDVAVMDSGIAVAIQNLYGPPVRHDTTVSQIALPSFEGMDGLYLLKVK